jgi:hypothetical protein
VLRTREHFVVGKPLPRDDVKVMTPFGRAVEVPFTFAVQVVVLPAATGFGVHVTVTTVKFLMAASAGGAAKVKAPTTRAAASTASCSDRRGVEVDTSSPR